MEKKKERKQKRNLRVEEKGWGGNEKRRKVMWRSMVTPTAALGTTWGVKPKWGGPRGLDEKNRVSL